MSNSFFFQSLLEDHEFSGRAGFVLFGRALIRHFTICQKAVIGNLAFEDDFELSLYQGSKIGNRPVRFRSPFHQLTGRILVQKVLDTLDLVCFKFSAIAARAMIRQGSDAPCLVSTAPFHKTALTAIADIENRGSGFSTTIKADGLVPDFGSGIPAVAESGLQFIGLRFG